MHLFVEIYEHVTTKFWFALRTDGVCSRYEVSLVLNGTQ